MCPPSITPSISLEEYTLPAIREYLESLADPKRVKSMARAGIVNSQALGIKIPVLRDLAKQIGKDHGLAQQLWYSGTHELMMLASLVDDPKQVTVEQMDAWAKDFYSWDIVDGTIGNLFDQTPFAYQKAIEWRHDPHEYIKRAGFVLMARMAVGKSKCTAEQMDALFPMLIEGAKDERNMVKKAVNWALRQLGKFNVHTNKLAIETAEKIAKIGCSAAKWIAADALRELRSKIVQDRLKKKHTKAKSKMSKIK